MTDPTPPRSRAVATRRSLEAPEPWTTPRYSSTATPSGGTTGLSPFNRSQKKATRFFLEPSHAKPTTKVTTTTTTVTTVQKDAPQDIDDNNDIDDDTWVDGLPLAELRQLATQALLQAPHEATFYAGLVYAKRPTPANVLLLAQAHYQAGQYPACLQLLLEGDHEEKENNGRTNSVWWMPRLLLACQAWAATHDWNTLLEHVEDACRLSPHSLTGGGDNYGNDNNNDNDKDESFFPHFSNNATGTTQAFSRPLEDADEYGWDTLYASMTTTSDNNDNTIHPLARLCTYRGRAYYETGHGHRAALYWKRALHMDCRSLTAWWALVEHALLTPLEAHALIASLDFDASTQYLKALYLTRLEVSTPAANDVVKDKNDNDNDNEQHHKPPHETNTTPGHSFGLGADESSIALDSPPLRRTRFESPTTPTPSTTAPPQPDPQALQVQRHVQEAFDQLQHVYKLQDSPQVLAMSAKRAYRRYQWQEVLQYCGQLRQVDPTLETAGACFVYVAALLLCGHKRTLFSLAHEWVEASAQSAPAWFAVGAYYSACGRHHVAQRHFCRATRLDPQCTAAWIAFGCSFAACDESDQALASFRAAQRLSPGEHTSLLYMGMEYNRTNHLVLAHNFLNTALVNSGHADPLCWHELGVLAAHKGDAAQAVHCFEQALRRVVPGAVDDNDNSSNKDLVEWRGSEWVELCVDPYWEATIFNLGHALRKTRQYEAARICYARCISLCPDKCSGYSAYGLICQLLGQVDTAVEYYHQALSCQPDDNFATEMLNRALSSSSSGSRSTSSRGFSMSSPLPDVHQDSSMTSSSSARGLMFP